jgi:hypothetical protein
VLGALKSFGAPLHDLTEDYLVRPGTVFQIGVAPVRIEVHTAIDGVRFADAWPTRILTKFAEVEVGVLSREHLIQDKRAREWLQDLADVEWLGSRPRWRQRGKSSTPATQWSVPPIVEPCPRRRMSPCHAARRRDRPGRALAALGPRGA